MSTSPLNYNTKWMHRVLETRMLFAGFTRAEIDDLRPTIQSRYDITMDSVDVGIRIGSKVWSMRLDPKMLERKDLSNEDILEHVAGVGNLKSMLYLHRMEKRMPGKIESVRLAGEMITITFKSGRKVSTTQDKFETPEFLATCILVE